MQPGSVEQVLGSRWMFPGHLNGGVGLHGRLGRLDEALAFGRSSLHLVIGSPRSSKVSVTEGMHSQKAGTWPCGRFGRSLPSLAESFLATAPVENG